MLRFAKMLARLSAAVSVVLSIATLYIVASVSYQEIPVLVALHSSFFATVAAFCLYAWADEREAKRLIIKRGEAPKDGEYVKYRGRH